MRDSILRKIYRRVQLSRAEGIVLDAILSKANLYGKFAKVAYECLAAITGFSVRHVMRLVKSLIYERRLLRVDKRVLWPGHNAINAYHVVIPWRREVSFADMGIGRKPVRSDRVNNKYDKTCHPNTHQEEKSPCQPARLCTEPASEKVASAFWTPGSRPWHYAQGLTPPGENGENGRETGNEG
jgi:hypothetical protein